MTLSERWDAQAARTRLDEAGQRLFELSNSLRTELHDTRSYTDPGMNADGLQRRRGELVRGVRERYAPQLEQLTRQVSQDAAAVAAWATQNRPTIGEDAVALQRASMAWDGVRARLDAGMRLQQVLATASRVEVLAIAEWGPALLEAQHFAGSDHGLAAGYERPDLANFRRSVDDRLAEVLDEDGDASISLGLTREAEIAVAKFQPLADNAAALVRGDAGAVEAGLEAAIRSRIEGQLAARGPVADDTDGAA